ncbi:MAG: hypothetical protein A2Z34_07185 [Planctomycetes bacterium RBG_16_59_8]|nr:MAG: hypothetical protein A2Z34_07185 [Planctomycetes bacterium RBG_16_59_8]
MKHAILPIRGYRVMLDSDLAVLYGVTTFNLNKAVKRNLIRFPSDFMFRITPGEFDALTFHFGISKHRRGGRRFLPYAFTEQGVAMLSSILRSKRAVLVNIQIMRAFVRMRKLVYSRKDVARRINALEKQMGEHDEKIHVIFDTIRDLLESNESKTPRIGFRAHNG